MSSTTGSASLQAYVPRLALNWERHAGDQLWAEIEGSMVLADISGFTKMSERLARKGRIGAEEITDVIGDTFGKLLGEAYRLGGDLLRFGGDALLLFFEGAGHALRATAAAHGMRAELRDSGVCYTSAGQVTLRMSVGAHSGLFTFFLVGNSHRELVVAGPGSTRAARMEEAAKAGQILISPEMAEVLPARMRGRVSGPGVLLQSGHVETEQWAEPDQGEVDPRSFLPVAYRDEVLAGGLQPEHRSATVAFVQFADFDGLVTTQGPQAAATGLDALVDQVQQAVNERGLCFLASDISAVGGKLILTGGVPRASGNDEELMLLALNEIISADRDLPVRIGVNRGQVFSGEIGPPFRRTYTVMGDTVNLAARVMAKAEIGQVLSTPVVLEGSRTLFETTELEPFQVKGKKKPITAYSVGPASGSRTSIAEVGLPLIGRDKELTILQQGWESSSGGDGRMVELTAEPGMGKTRLLDEFLENNPDIAVMRTACRLYRATTPYFPMRALLRGLLHLEGDTDEEQIAGLQKLVEEACPDLSPWIALLGVPLGLEIPESEEVRLLDTEFRRERLEDAVDALLVAIVTEPVLMTLDDVHWMDEASAKLMAKLAGSVTTRPWLLVVSRRPVDSGFIAPDDGPGIVKIRLEALGEEHSAALIDAATTDRLLPPEQVRELAARAEGNPLFLIELLDALNRGADVSALPQSVEGLIGARIDRLQRDDLRTLRRLSVLGPGFLAVHAPAVLDGENARTALLLIRRLSEFLTVDSRGWVRFRHALIRDAAYQGLPFRSRQYLHGRIAESILRDAGDEPEQQAALLSLHYFEAGNWKEAWRFGRVAADDARDTYAPVEAERLYTRALAAAKRLAEVDPGDQIEVLSELAEVAEQAGMFDRSLEALREGIRYARGDSVTLSGLHLQRARALFRTGRYSQALRETAVGLNAIEECSGSDADRSRAQLLAVRANIRLNQGRPSEALKTAEVAMDVAEETEEMYALARAYQVLDGANEMLGRHDKVVYADEMEAIYEMLGDLQGCAIVAANRGVADYFAGRWDDALKSFDRARDMFLKAGNETQAAGASASMGEVLVGQGRLKEAEPLLVHAVRMLRAHNHIDRAINAETQLGRLKIKAGDLDEGVTLLTDLYAEATVAGDWSTGLEVTAYLTQGLTAQGKPEGALELLEMTKVAAAEDLEVFAASLARARAGVLLALGHVEEASEQIERGLVSAQEQGLLFEESQLLVMKSTLLNERGTPDPELLEKAHGLFQQLGVREPAAA